MAGWRGLSRSGKAASGIFRHRPSGTHLAPRQGMDARERWQALQARLTAARAAVDDGNRERALEEITAALELDKDFLAAQALRDRITSMNPEDASAASEPQRSTPPVHTAPAAAPVATTPVEGAAPILAKFEQRAKRRRVDRRIDAARAAIAQQRLKAAAAALDEIIDLDPNLPELAELTARVRRVAPCVGDAASRSVGCRGCRFRRRAPGRHVAAGLDADSVAPDRGGRAAAGPTHACPRRVRVVADRHDRCPRT